MSDEVPKIKNTSLVDQWITWFKSHPVFAVLILVGGAIIGIAKVLSSGEQIGDVVNPKPKDQNKITIDVTSDSNTKSIYKPYWELKHSDSDETRRNAFSQLLIQQDTKNYSGVNLKELDFSPPDGSLTVNSFKCSGCNFTEVQFRKTSWQGNLLFSNSRFRHVEFVQGSMERPVFTNTTITNDYQDSQGVYTRRGFLQAMNVENLLFIKSTLRNALIIGFPDRDLDKLDIEGLSGSLFHYVTFQDLKISAKQARKDSFFETTFNNVEFHDTELKSIDFSEIRIEEKLTIKNSILSSVTFSEKQRQCIEFSDTDLSEISWIAEGTGKCADVNEPK